MEKVIEMGMSEAFSRGLIRPEMLMTENPQELVKKRIIKDQIKKALKSLSLKERKVLELRFGLIDENPKTLIEVGQTLSITRERVRTIEFKALKKLRKKFKKI